MNTKASSLIIAEIIVILLLCSSFPLSSSSQSYQAARIRQRRASSSPCFETEKNYAIETSISRFSIFPSTRRLSLLL